MKRRYFLKHAATAAAFAGLKQANGQNKVPTLHGAAAETSLPFVKTVNGIGRRKLG